MTLATQSGSYGTGTRIFHWLVVAALIVQIPAGIVMIVPAPLLEQRTIDILYIIHKGLGGVLIGVILLRALWRIFARTPEMPRHWPEAERAIALHTHRFIYFLLVVVVASGYTRVMADGYPIELFDWIGIPPLLPKMPAVAPIASLVHRFAVFVLVGVVAVHIAEVMRHQLVEKDGEMARMWPPIGGGSPKA